MTRAGLVAVALGLLGCRTADPAYRRELERTCAAPGHFNGGLRLATADGKALARAVDRAAPEERPLILLRAARHAGLASCGGVPTRFAARRLPAIDPHGDPFLGGLGDGAALTLDPDLRWRDARAQLTAGGGSHLVVARGYQIGTIALGADAPPDDDLGLTVAAGKDGLAIYATATDLEGSPTLPRLLLRQGPDGFDAAVIAAVLGDVAAASEQRVRYQTPAYRFARIRWIADDDARLGDVTPALGLVSGRLTVDDPLPIQLGGEATAPIVKTDAVALLPVLGDLRTPARPAIAAQVEGEYRAALAACYPAGTPVAGTLELDTAIYPDGTMRPDPAVRTFGVPAVDDCVKAQARTWRFPPQPQGTELIVRVAMGLTPA